MAQSSKIATAGVDPGEPPRCFCGKKAMVKPVGGSRVTRRSWTISAAIATVPDFDPTQTDRMFRIYVSDYTLAALVPRLLRRIAGRGYGVRSDFRLQTDTPQRTLESGEADLLIIRGSATGSTATSIAANVMW